MTAATQIKAYLASLPEPKRGDMQALHRRLLALTPATGTSKRRWFSDGRDERGKVVTNPIIGYGLYTHTYADGTPHDTFRIGLSATSSGISIYMLGLADKTALQKKFASTLGKATVAGGGYCLRFKRLADIDMEVLEEAVRYGFSTAAGETRSKKPTKTKANAKRAAVKPTKR